MADILGPAAAFRFVVTGARGTAGFLKCTGLTDEQEIYEYREGNSPSLAKRQIPGLKTTLKFTLEKGITEDGVAFASWRKEAEKCQGFRSTINVRINNCDGSPALSINALNAWPSKLVVEDLDSMTSAAARISMEIVHEGLEVGGLSAVRSVQRGGSIKAF